MNLRSSPAEKTRRLIPTSHRHLGHFEPDGPVRHALQYKHSQAVLPRHAQRLPVTPETDRTVSATRIGASLCVYSRAESFKNTILAHETCLRGRATIDFGSIDLGTAIDIHLVRMVLVTP